MNMIVSHFLLVTVHSRGHHTNYILIRFQIVIVMEVTVLFILIAPIH